MTREEIEELYRITILPESKNPYHFEKKKESDLVVKAYNPLCGDKFELYFDLEDDKIESAYFHGIGCAISKASCSLLARYAEGLPLDQLKDSLSEFLSGLNSGSKGRFEEGISVLMELRNFEGRLDCIKLPWEALALKLESK